MMLWYLPPLLFSVLWLVAFLLRRIASRSQFYRVIGCGGTCLCGLVMAVCGNDLQSLLTPVHLMASFLGFLAVPRRVLERPEAHLLFLLQAIIIFLLEAEHFESFALGFLAAGFLLAFFVVREAKRHTVDPLRFERMNLYLLYRLLSLFGILVLVVSLRGTVDQIPSFDTLTTLELSQSAKWGLLIVIMASLGLVPLHSWFPSLLAAPRLNLFIPLFAVELGLILFFRIYIPLHTALGEMTQLLIWSAAISLIYAALLLFAEVRLKRIVGYLIMSHLSLMVLALASGSHDGLIGARVDGVNLFLGTTGLVMSLSILTSRFGLQGVTTPSGLAGAFPEVGICVLLCTLSLVGFPGTVGYISEELFFKSSLEYRASLLPIVILSVALNGYSCFRIFARVFFGSSSFVASPELALRLRERVALMLLVLLLLVNGLAPQVLVPGLTSVAGSGSASH